MTKTSIHQFNYGPPTAEMTLGAKAQIAWEARGIEDVGLQTEPLHVHEAGSDEHPLVIAWFEERLDDVRYKLIPVQRIHLRH